MPEQGKDANRKFVEIVFSYPLKYPLRFREDYFYWPARMMMDKGFGVEFLTLEPGKKDEIHDGVRVKRFGSTYSLLSYINRDKAIRLVHAHLRPYPPCFFGGFSNKPKVLTPHTYILGSNPLIARLSVLMLNKYDRVIALTPHERDIYLKAGVKESRVVLLPHPVDYRFYSASIKNSGSVKRRLGIADGEFVIVTVANIRKCKRMDTLLRAFSIVCSRAKAKLIIVGDDMLWQEHSPSVSSMAKQLGLRNVVQTGYLEPEKVRETLSVSDVFACTSDIEAQGLSVYEAAAAGLPLCLSNIGSLTSVFGERALYNSPGDHKKLAENLLYYLNNPAQAKRSAAKLKQFVRQFDFSVMRKKMERLYMDVLDSSG